MGRGCPRNYRSRAVTRGEKLNFDFWSSTHAVIMPSPSSTATGTHLTTSRIHRILRPLKTKCASFAVAASLAGGQSTGGNRMSRTNSSSSSPTNPGEPPPLAVLPPPEQTRHFKSSSQYDSSWNQLSLSKNIYGIRDAFKNVLNIAFGGGWDDSPSRNFASSSMSVDSDPSTSNRHVVSLAGLCAIVVGKELGMGQDGDGGDDEDGTDDENCENDDEEVTKWVDGIYEEIPFHVRRYVPPQHLCRCLRGLLEPQVGCCLACTSNSPPVLPAPSDAPSSSVRGLHNAPSFL